MKLKPIILLSFLLLTYSALQAYYSGEPEIVVKKGKFSFNKFNVSENWSVYQLKEVIPREARIRTGYNITHTYDNLGIVIFESTKSSTGTGAISEVQVYFKVMEPNEVTPKNNTNASVKIDKLKINADLGKAAMLKGMLKWQQSESYLEHSYRMSKAGTYIYFQFSDYETQLLKISIGKDKKPSP